MGIFGVRCLLVTRILLWCTNFAMPAAGVAIAPALSCQLVGAIALLVFRRKPYKIMGRRVIPLNDQLHPEEVGDMLTNDLEMLDF